VKTQEFLQDLLEKMRAIAAPDVKSAIKGAVKNLDLYCEVLPDFWKIIHRLPISRALSPDIMLNNRHLVLQGENAATVSSVMWFRHKQCDPLPAAVLRPTSVSDTIQ
jgi:hypothetical protein